MENHDQGGNLSRNTSQTPERHVRIVYPPLNEQPRTAFHVGPDVESHFAAECWMIMTTWKNTVMITGSGYDPLLKAFCPDPFR